MRVHRLSLAFLLLAVTVSVTFADKETLTDEYSKNKNNATLPPPRSSSESSDDEVSSSNSGRKASIFRGTQRVVISVTPPTNGTNSSTPTNRSLVLSFAVLDTPRIGIEWRRDAALLNGTKNPDIVYSVRLVGMAEINGTATNPATTQGTKYRFEQFRWGPIQVVRNVSDPTLNSTTAKLQTFWSVGTYNNSANSSLRVNVSISISPEPVNSSLGWKLGPNSIKYGIQIAGTPAYRLSPANASSWKFFKAVFSSSNKVNFSQSALVDNVQRLDWLTTLVVDGANKTITVDDLNSTTIEPGAKFQGDNTSARETDLDSRCRFRMVSWTLPYFNSSLNWDPSVSIDDSAAAVQADAGAFDSANSGAVVPSVSSWALAALVFFSTLFVLMV